MNGVSLPETVIARSVGLSGQVPSSLGDLGPSLTELDLEGNSMIGGSVPTGVGLLGGLEILNLKLNSVNGVLPTEVGALTSLTDLDLGSNSIDGSLPTEIGALTDLVDLDLSANQLTAVPTEIGALTGLVDLDLSTNELTSVPTEIGALAGLTKLDLGTNELPSVPTELAALTGLAVLSLSENLLTVLGTEFRDFSPSSECDMSDNPSTAAGNLNCENLNFFSTCCTETNCFAPSEEARLSACYVPPCSYTDSLCATGAICPGGTAVSAACADRSAFDESPCACTALQELAALSSDLRGKAPWSALAISSYCTVPEGDYYNYYYDYDYTDMDLQVKCTLVGGVKLPQGGEWCFPFTATEWRTAGKARD